MAERKIAVVAVLCLVTVMVVVALVPVVKADACNDECSRECKKGKKEAIHSCTNTCDDMCRLKATSPSYAPATPDEKAAIVTTFEKEASAASSAASTPGFDRLNSGCLRECNKNLCRAGKKDDPACTARCDKVCRAEVGGLAFAAKTYAESPAADKEAVDQAIDKQSSRPNDKIEALATTCTNECIELCEKDPGCVSICENGCHSRSVNLAFSLSTPAEKEEIKNDIEAASPTASKLVGTD